MRRLLLVTCLVTWWAGAAFAADPAEVTRGKYIFGAAGGCGCHTEPKGQPNAGGKKFEGPFGTVYATSALNVVRNGSVMLHELIGWLAMSASGSAA